MISDAEITRNQYLDKKRFPVFKVIDIEVVDLIIFGSRDINNNESLMGH